MDYLKWLGNKAEDFCLMLDKNNIKYQIKETSDTKNTKMGNDMRIVKIVEDDVLIIYTALF